MEKKGKFDYILLETTGLADPGPIAAMFWLDDDLGSDIYLDGMSSHLITFKCTRQFTLTAHTICEFTGVITVVDSKHCLQVIESTLFL